MSDRDTTRDRRFWVRELLPVLGDRSMVLLRVLSQERKERESDKEREIEERESVCDRERKREGGDVNIISYRHFIHRY